MNSDVIVEGESPEVNLRRWSIRPLRRIGEGEYPEANRRRWSVAKGDALRSLEANRLCE